MMQIKENSCLRWLGRIFKKVGWVKVIDGDVDIVLSKAEWIEAFRPFRVEDVKRYQSKGNGL
jgi:hypothetical protein